MSERRAGYIALTGRPNVGKSTLLNYLVEATVAITSPKPQTTRHVIRGVATRGDNQFVFLDTPGLHRPNDLLGGVMMRNLNNVIADADVIILMIDAGSEPVAADVERLLIKKIAAEDTPAVLVLNKIDRRSKAGMLPLIEHYRQFDCFCAFVPLSAATGEGVDLLLDELARLLPEQPWIFDEDNFTDQTERDLAAELIRRELVYQLREELPYGMAVQVVSFAERESEGRRKITIEADIVCDRQNHKGMVVGRKGERVKAVGTAARTSLETLFDADVTLFLQVRVQSGWRDSEAKLKDLGFS